MSEIKLNGNTYYISTPLTNGDSKFARHFEANRSKPWSDKTSDPLGDINEIFDCLTFEFQNDCTRGKSVLTTAKTSMSFEIQLYMKKLVDSFMIGDEKERVVVLRKSTNTGYSKAYLSIAATLAFEKLEHYNELDTMFSLEALARRYTIAPDEPKISRQQSWQSMNRGEFSKKQRRNK